MPQKFFDGGGEAAALAWIHPFQILIVATD